MLVVAKKHYMKRKIADVLCGCQRSSTVRSNFENCDEIIFQVGNVDAFHT